MKEVCGEDGRHNLTFCVSLIFLVQWRTQLQPPEVGSVEDLVLEEVTVVVAVDEEVVADAVAVEAEVVAERKIPRNGFR